MEFLKGWFFLLGLFLFSPAECGEMLAGAARVDITRAGAPAPDNPLWVRALVLSDGETEAVIVTVDAVAIAEIGSIRDPYLANVRKRLKADLGIDPESVLINASHCHGIVANDVEDRTVAAVKKAREALVPVKTGAGRGRENRVMINRRMKMKNGKTIDVRHAYSLPPDSEIESVGSIDPEIGILRIDRADDGQPLALVYNFACHPIQGIPGGGNTADLSGYASRVIEQNLGGECLAFFLQGCGGDINPVLYKEVDQPRDAETLGNRLGLSTLSAARTVETAVGVPFQIVNETIELPRADLAPRIEEVESEISSLIDSFKGTSLNFETFLPLYIKYRLSRESPSTFAHRYLQDKELGKSDWDHLDEVNRRNIQAYIKNIHTMEGLTRKQINLALLKKHQSRNAQEKMKPVSAEVVGLRVGEFRLVTFPAELTVGVGLAIKEKSPHDLTFIAGYTNGYLYYAATEEQLKNRGGAQEDSDSLLAPEWQAIFESKALEILKSF